MKTYNIDTDLKPVGTLGNNSGIWDRLSRTHNIMIPIDIGTRNQTIGFYPVTNQDLPEGGQNNLNEITGTPFKAELAGLTVIASPVQPDIKKSYIKALVSISDSIDRIDQSKHSQETEMWAQRLAERIGLPANDIENIGLAGKLHDIGKAVLSKELLQKDGPLSHEEWVIIKKHPGYSAALMEPSARLNPVRLIVRSHHECYDGKGYPDGLAGEDIPVGARILSIVDAFASMVSGRVYRKAMQVNTALEELTVCSGTQFDPELVYYMKEIVKMFVVR